jgi:hypothetical protein
MCKRGRELPVAAGAWEYLCTQAIAGCGSAVEVHRYALDTSSLFQPHALSVRPSQAARLGETPIIVVVRGLHVRAALREGGNTNPETLICQRNPRSKIHYEAAHLQACSATTSLRPLSPTRLLGGGKICGGHNDVAQDGYRGRKRAKLPILLILQVLAPRTTASILGTVDPQAATVIQLSRYMYRDL